MKFAIYDQFSDKLEHEWTSVLQQSENTNPFLSYHYQKHWWSTLGGGEWQQGNLKVIVGYRDERVIGIAPFFQVSTSSKKELRLIGSVEISDYLDLIVAENDYEEFLSDVTDFLMTKIDLWDQIVLDNIPESSPLIKISQSVNLSSSITFSLEKIQPSPYLQLEEDWESYLANIDKKQRHEIRRKLRRLENESESNRFFLVTDHDELVKYTDIFLNMMSEDNSKQEFLTPTMREHMRELLTWSFEDGITKLFFLEINNKPAAGYFCFDDERAVYIYNSGFSSEMRFYSPGWVLVSQLIQWAIEEKRSTVDFMRGDESYKYKFGAVDSFVYRAVIERNS